MYRKYKKTISALVVTLTILVCYVGSFCIVRQRIVFTAAIPSGNLSGQPSVTLYYFSKDKTLNRLLFVFYFPLHLHLPANMNDLIASPPPYEHYVEDIRLLKQLGAVGF
jgi:hypothetical protein